MREPKYNVGDMIYFNLEGKRYCKIVEIQTSEFDGGFYYGWWTDSSERVEIIHGKNLLRKFNESWGSMGISHDKEGDRYQLHLYKSPMDEQMLKEIEEEYI